MANHECANDNRDHLVQWPKMPQSIISAPGAPTVEQASPVPHEAASLPGFQNSPTQP